MSTATQGIARINTTIEILWLLFLFKQEVLPARPAQLAELPRSEFDPELFPHSAYVKLFVTFATKVP